MAAEFQVLEELTTPEQIEEAIRECAEGIGRTIRNLPAIDADEGEG